MHWNPQINQPIDQSLPRTGKPQRGKTSASPYLQPFKTGNTLWPRMASIIIQAVARAALTAVSRLVIILDVPVVLDHGDDGGADEEDCKDGHVLVLVALRGLCGCVDVWSS